MRIAIHSSFIAGICVASLVSGCGVSSDRYIDDATTLDSKLTEPPDIYGYTPPARSNTTDASGSIAPRYQDAPRIVTRHSEVDEGDVVIVVDDDRWVDWQDTPRNRDFYRADVNNTLNALDHEVTEIKARANIKGAAARAAIDPHVRDYNMAIDVIEENHDPLFANGGDDWLLRAQRIENALEQAYRAIDRAEQALRDTPTYD